MIHTTRKKINTTGQRLLAFVRSLGPDDRAEAAALVANMAPIAVRQDWMEERGQPRRMARKLAWALQVTGGQP